MELVQGKLCGMELWISGEDERVEMYFLAAVGELLYINTASSEQQRVESNLPRWQAMPF